MKFNLFSTTRRAFGLDVNGDSLKVVQIGGKDNNLEVKGYVDTVLPKGVVISDAVTDQATFDHMLKKSLANPDFGHIDTEYVVASLPETKSFVRVIQIPKLSEGEADNAVAFEAESFIPMPLDQVYLDWQPIGEAGDKLNVLITASPKEFVDKYLDILDKCGLKTVALEVESQSCVRALTNPQEHETLLIVDLDSYRSSLIMVENGSLQFTSTVPIAGNAFTESVAKALGITNIKAETIKRKVGIASVPEYPNLKTSMLPVLNNLAAEIKNIIKFYSEHSQHKVEKIVLCGGSAKLKNLPEYLGMELTDVGIAKVQLAEGQGTFVDPKLKEQDDLRYLSFTTAIGLAMRGRDYEIY